MEKKNYKIETRRVLANNISDWKHFDLFMIGVGNCKILHFRCLLPSASRPAAPNIQFTKSQRVCLAPLPALWLILLLLLLLLPTHLPSKCSHRRNGFLPSFSLKNKDNHTVASNVHTKDPQKIDDEKNLQNVKNVDIDEDHVRFNFE